MTLDDLLTVLDSAPVITDIHPVSLCFLPADVMVLESAAEAAWLLDDPRPIPPQRMLITESEPFYRNRFRHVRCDHDPFSPALNGVLSDHFDEAATRTLRQSQVATRFATDVGRFDIIALLLVDGLSYEDVREWVDASSEITNIEPCLVDVPTLTRVAFPNLIGDPPLAARLFDMGFHSRLGFTYWRRDDNRLTNQLFDTIAEVEKVGQFPQLLEILRLYLRHAGEGKTYIQIVRTGLDGFAHGQKRKPPVAAIVEEIRKEAEALVDLFRGTGRPARLCLSADHGILWQDEFEPEIVGRAPGKSSPRWCGWRDLYFQEERGRRFLIDGEEYYCLGFPKLRRPLHLDEQGVHGGISYQESVVPFVTWEVNPHA